MTGFSAWKRPYKLLKTLIMFQDISKNFSIKTMTKEVWKVNMITPIRKNLLMCLQTMLVQGEMVELDCTASIWVNKLSTMIQETIIRKNIPDLTIREFRQRFHKNISLKLLKNSISNRKDEVASIAYRRLRVSTLILNLIIITNPIDFCHNILPEKSHLLICIGIMDWTEIRLIENICWRLSMKKTQKMPNPLHQ